MKSLLLAAILLLAPAAHAAATDAAATACEAKAKAWFAKTFPQPKRVLKSGRTLEASYVAHFAAKSARCTLRRAVQISANDKSESARQSTLLDLSDPKYKQIAGLIVVGEKVRRCDFEGKPCATAKDWEILAAPLLKE